MAANQHEDTREDMFRQAYNMCLPYCSRWRQAAIALNFTSYDIERINRDECKEQDRLLAMLIEWTARNPNGTLGDVWKAMVVAKNNCKLPRRRNKSLPFYLCVSLLSIFGFCAISFIDIPVVLSYLTKSQTSTHLNQPTTSLQPTLQSSPVRVKQETIDAIDATYGEFLLLFSKMQVQLNQQVTENPERLEELHRFMCNMFNVPYDTSINNQSDHIDYLFKRFRQYYNYMDTSLLSILDKQFLDGFFEKKISIYRDSMKVLRNSISISELANEVRVFHRQFDSDTEIVLELVDEIWNTKNLENLENLMKHVFGNDTAALLVLIKIHHSILTIVYAMPIELATSVSSKASQPENNHKLKLAGARAVEVNSDSINVNVIFINDSETAEPMDMSLVLFDTIMNTTTVSMVGDIQFIVDIGADVDYDNGTYTPLVLAVAMNNVPVVLELVKLNADINKASVGSGKFPLSLASISGQLNMVKVLLANKANVSKPFLHGNNALHLAALKNHTELLRFLLFHTSDPNTKNSHDSTPLHIASYHGHSRSCQILLESLSDINAVDSCGLTPLMVASIKDHPLVVDLLLKYGSDTSYKCNSTGYDSLHLSTVLGHLECVMKHIQRKVDLDSQTSNGVSALHLAAFNGHEQLVKVLLEAGATVNIHTTTTDNEYTNSSSEQQVDGITPLMVTSDTNIVELLLHHGADPNTVYTEGQTSPLNLAVYYGYKDIVELLLEHGAMVSHTMVTGSPLSIGAMISTGGSNTWTIMNMLVLYGDINIRDPHYDDATPLMIAIVHGNIEVVELLLESGSDVEVRNKYNENAIDLAGKVLVQQFGLDSLSLIKSQVALIIWKMIIKKQEEECSLMDRDSLSVLEDTSTDDVHVLANKTVPHTDEPRQLQLPKLNTSPRHTAVSFSRRVRRRNRQEVTSEPTPSEPTPTSTTSGDHSCVYELVYTVRYLIPKCTKLDTSRIVVPYQTQFGQVYSFYTELSKLMPRISTSIDCYDDMIESCTDTNSV